MWPRTKFQGLRADTADFKPIRVVQVEISEPLPAISSDPHASDLHYERALLLVRLHARPIGEVMVNLGEHGLSPAALGQEIWKALSKPINDHLQQDGWPEVATLGELGISGEGVPRCVQARQALHADAPFASVVIATHNRPESLALTLASLDEQDYPCFEVIVVDNAPGNDATAKLVRQLQQDRPNLHYIREDHPGLGLAHNRGLELVRGTIVAFTDDDVRVDQHWLTELAAGFYAAENVGCVTGMIFPLELQTPAQVWLEQYGGFSKGFAPRVFDLHENRPRGPLFPYTAGWLGSGANMAFRTSVLRELGGFDPALGAGTIAQGGDDLAAFFEVIARGYRLVYQPTAIVHHAHRRDYEGLRRQAYGYGVGLAAYLTRAILEKPSRLLDMAVRMPFGFAYLLSSRSPKNAKKPADYPKELNREERKGMLYGPVAYVRSRRRLQAVTRAARAGMGRAKPRQNHGGCDNI